MVYLTRLETFLFGCLDKTICNLSRSFNGVVLIYIDFVIFCVRAKYIRFWILLKEKQTHTAGSDTIFFSYFLTCEVYLIEVLEIMAQMRQYIIFLSLKPIKVSSDFILNYLKKVVGGATTQKYQKQTQKP